MSKAGKNDFYRIKIKNPTAGRKLYERIGRLFTGHAKVIAAATAVLRRMSGLEDKYARAIFKRPGFAELKRQLRAAAKYRFPHLIPELEHLLVQLEIISQARDEFAHRWSGYIEDSETIILADFMGITPDNGIIALKFDAGSIDDMISDLIKIELRFVYLFLECSKTHHLKNTDAFDAWKYIHQSHR